jgi:4-hydroxyproline epimerase
MSAKAYDVIVIGGGIVGSVFEGTVLVRDNVVHPRIKGSAFITAEADLIIDERDPFAVGIR